MTNHTNPPNHLIASKSPYLQQHAYNPVEWHPWSELAWEKAKSENKLVLVSIGYSTCHWCHVMEHESFEDHETAEIMNIGMINIKVDREERPDIDMVYMDACQLMTGRGGWPLNVICLPDGRPVYAGTYFQKPQWQQLVLQLTSQFRTQPESFTDYAQKFMDELQKMNKVSTPTGEIMNFSKKESLDIFENYAKDIDWEHGAKQRAPKFMVPIQFEYALDFHLCTRIPEAKEYLHLSLLKMANGGIYDSIRGGFFRYSTDNRWFAPHFEKMLYDNAQLISLYARAYAWSKADIYRDIVEQTIAFCDRELSDNASFSGYFSGLDADSEGVEGKFYTFTMNEIEKGMNSAEITATNTNTNSDTDTNSNSHPPKFSPAEIQFLQVAYGVTTEGNWEHDMNIIHTAKAPLQVMEELKITAAEYHSFKTSVQSKLFALQESRIRPSLDYKIICSWNGLMIKALADAGYYLNAPKYIQKATELAHQMWSIFWQPQSQQLFRIHSQNATYNDGFLEDYASFSLGMLELFKFTGDSTFLDRAKTLIDCSIDLFYNHNNHQFEFVGKSSETLIIQKTDLTDDVIPSANSMLAKSLHQLFEHYSDVRYRELYLELLATVKKSVTQHPSWYSGWAQLYLMEAFEPAHIAVHQASCPDSDQIAHWPSWISVLTSQENTKATWLQINDQQPNGFYLCLGNRCLEPVSNWSQIEEILEEMYSLNESIE